MRNIYKTKIDLGSFGDGRSRLFVEFADIKGKLQGNWEWTPAWDDVRDLMVKAVEVERRNNPGSMYLEQFASLCSEVIVKYAPAEHVEIKGGRCIEYWVDREKSKSFVKVLYREITDRPGWIAGEDVWELAISISEERLRSLIDRDVRWVVWDGRVIEIRGG